MKKEKLHLDLLVSKWRSAAFQIMRRHCELFTMFKVSSPSHYTTMHRRGGGEQGGVADGCETRARAQWAQGEAAICGIAASHG